MHYLEKPVLILGEDGFGRENTPEKSVESGRSTINWPNSG